MHRTGTSTKKFDQKVSKMWYKTVKFGDVLNCDKYERI